MNVAARRVAQSASPFHLLLGRTGRHDDLEQLMVTFEDKFPGKRSRMALKTLRELARCNRGSLAVEGRRTSTVVDVLDIDATQRKASLDRVYLIGLAGRGQAEALAIQ